MAATTIVKRPLPTGVDCTATFMSTKPTDPKIDTELTDAI